VRDFIHIDDIIEATLKAVELDIQEPINLGWGRPTSFNELAKIMFKIANFKKEPKIKHRLDKPTGVDYRCCNNKRMLSFYKPKISLEEELKKLSRLIIYEKNNCNNHHKSPTAAIKKFDSMKDWQLIVIADKKHQKTINLIREYLLQQKCKKNMIKTFRSYWLELYSKKKFWVTLGLRFRSRHNSSSR